jgi:signal transduction histidine kinase
VYDIHFVLYLHTTLPRHFVVEDLNLVTVLAHMAAIRREQEILAERERAEREEKIRLEQLADNRRRALEAAEMVRYAETRAVLAEASASIGRLAAAVSHDVNTPLGALKSSVETLLRVAEKSRTASDPARFFEMAEDLCKSITASADRLNTIVARMRRVTNLDRADVQEVDVGDLLNDIVQLASADAGDRFLLTLPELPPIVSRPQAISAVFSAVLEYCGQAGALISAAHTDDTIHIRIEQPGRVLPEDELIQLFEPSFRSADGRMRSHNLGLFSARHLIRELGGELYAESSEGRGTVFTVQLHSPRARP